MADMIDFIQIWLQNRRLRRELRDMESDLLGRTKGCDDALQYISSLREEIVKSEKPHYYQN
jgi:hypothetical protein